LEVDQVSVVDSPTVSAVGLAPMLTMTGLLAAVDAALPEAEVAVVDGVPPPPPPPQAVSRRQAATAIHCKQPLT
jgi:hypothetical protein